VKRAALILLACLTPTVALAAPKAEVVLTNNWRKVATPADKTRLMRWRISLLAAIAAANREGQAEAIAREGILLQPDVGLERPAIPVGDYNCRTIKLGRKGTYTNAFVVRPASRCTLTDKSGRMRLMTMNGNQRGSGDIFPSNEWRQVFLGTMTFSDETRAMDYGRDGARDMAGMLERIGEKRWRLLLPEPGFDSMMDVIEITPTN
jgi:Domain of unknown function (DUF4893)